MIVRISRIWMVSITLFDPGLKARCISAGHKGLHLGAMSVLLPLPSCDDVTVSLPYDNKVSLPYDNKVSLPCHRVVMGTLPEDVPPVGVGAFEARLWKVSVWWHNHTISTPWWPSPRRTESGYQQKGLPWTSHQWGPEHNHSDSRNKELV